MNSKNEDFPTPVSPTRRMVNRTFVSFFDVLMIPSLRASMLLENTVRTYSSGYCGNLLESRNGVPITRLEGVAGGNLDTGRITRAIRYPSLRFLVLYEDSRFGLDLNRGWHWRC
jgi:hypothetical protein